MNPKKKKTEQETSPIEEAKKILVGITEQNRIMADNIKKAEKISAENMIGGTTSAGKSNKKIEETPEDYAKRVLSNDL